MSDLRARLTALVTTWNEQVQQLRAKRNSGSAAVRELADAKDTARADALDDCSDDLAALLREPPDEPRCRCGVPTRVSHFCAVLDHCWVGARAAAPEECDEQTSTANH